MRHLVQQAGLGHEIEVDSAGTAAYHAGEPPDRRAREAGRRRGVTVGGVARQFRKADWDRFDYVLALDRANFDDLRGSAPSQHVLSKLHLLRTFDSSSPKGASVPDPYYGGDDGFDEVLDLCHAACTGLLSHIRREHGI